MVIRGRIAAGKAGGRDLSGNADVNLRDYRRGAQRVLLLGKASRDTIMPPSALGPFIRMFDDKFDHRLMSAKMR